MGDQKLTMFYGKFWYCNFNSKKCETLKALLETWWWNGLHEQETFAFSSAVVVSR